MQQNKSEVEFKKLFKDLAVVKNSGKELEFVIESNAYFYLGKDGGIEIYTLEEDMPKIGIPSLKLRIHSSNLNGAASIADEVHAALSAAYEGYERRERVKKDAYFASLLKSR